MYETAAALAYCLGNNREAFEYAKRARARFLLDCSLNKLSLTPRDKKSSELLQREAEVSQQVRMLTRRWQEHALAMGRAEAAECDGTASDIREQDCANSVNVEAALRRARAELLAIRQVIREQDPAFAALRGVTPASLEDVHALLDHESALLSYCVTEERLILFIVTQKGFWAEHINTPRHHLSNIVQEYRNQMETFGTKSRDIVLEEVSRDTASVDSNDSDIRLDSLARELYSILFYPAESHLRGKSRLVIIPHDDLHFLPFQALRSEHGYLVERFALWYAPRHQLAEPVLSTPASQSRTPARHG